jgi:hypothetical protein
MNIDPATLMGCIYGVSELGLSIRRRAASSDSRLAEEATVNVAIATDHQLTDAGRIAMCDIRPIRARS